MNPGMFLQGGILSEGLVTEFAIEDVLDLMNKINDSYHLNGRS
jgi:hypothetical protein